MSVKVSAPASFISGRAGTQYVSHTTVVVLNEMLGESRRRRFREVVGVNVVVREGGAGW